MDLPKNPEVSGYKACQILGVRTNAITNWRKRKSGSAGDLKQLPNGKYSMVDVARFLLTRGARGGKNAELREKGKEILKFYGEDPDKHAKEVKEKAPSNPTVVESESHLGIEHALKRVQTTEVVLAQKVEEAFLDPGELVVAINNWNKILEILRKTETDCLKVLEEKKVLVRIDDVREIYDKGILPAKTKLRQIPSVIAQDLVGLDRADIEELLEREIDRALEDVSNIWNS